jgi:hypothetical protein
VSSVMLIGAPGTGKTHSLVTLLEPPQAKLYVLCTEPGGIDTLAQKVTAEQRERLFYANIYPSMLSFGSMLKIARIVHSQTFEGLTQMKSGIEKKDFDQFLTLLSMCNDFVDQHGVHHGNIANLDANCIVALDSLSGATQMALDLVTGARDARAPGEWNVSAGMLTRFLQSLVAARDHSLFVCIAHVDREVNEITGQTILTASAVGAKMGPKLGRIFGDIVLCRRQKKDFTWDTTAEQTDTKYRLLLPGSALPPSFVPVMKKLNLGYKEKPVESVTEPPLALTN